MIRYRLCFLKPHKDVASSFLANELRLEFRIACDGLQQKFHHAEYSTCDLLISQSMSI